MLRGVTVTRLPLRVLTVLRAVPGGAPPGVEPVLDADGGPVSVRLDGKRDLCVAEDHVRAGDAVARW
jgi:hypothetical protein